MPFISVISILVLLLFDRVSVELSPPVTISLFWADCIENSMGYSAQKGPLSFPLSLSSARSPSFCLLIG